MAESKTDLRVVRTRKLIRNAFMDMVGEVGVARITVKDLTERAGINRKTFYLHFESIETLYDSVMNEVMNDFFDNYETTADQPKDLDGHAQRFFLFLVEQTPTIEKLICSPGPYDFGNHIYREQMMRYKSAGQDPFAWMDADAEELVLNFIRTTALDFYREWVRRGKRVDPQEAAALLGAITCHGARPAHALVWGLGPRPHTMMASLQLGERLPKASNQVFGGL